MFFLSSQLNLVPSFVGKYHAGRIEGSSHALGVEIVLREGLVNRRRVILQMLLVFQLRIAFRVRALDRLPFRDVPQVLAFEVPLQVATGAEGIRALLEIDVAVTQAEDALCGQAFDRDRN